MIRYELRYKIEGFPWRIFDTYKESEIHALKEFKELLSSQKHNDGIKVVKVTTTREDVDV